jgi:hypothetical protein
MSDIDWGKAGYPSGNPIPDDPGIVLSQVESIRAVAAALAAELEAMPSDGKVDSIVWESTSSDAPEEFRAVLKKLPRDLGLLHTRYTRVGDAMATFQQSLASAKALADNNVGPAARAYDDIEAAQHSISLANEANCQAQQAAAAANAHLAPGQVPASPHLCAVAPYHVQLQDAQRRYNNAKASIDQAVQRFHQASQTAAGAVNAASHDGLKNDNSWWGTFVNAVESAGHWVEEHVPLKAISGILGKIALVCAALSIIPGIGEVALAVAGAALLSSLVLSTACDVLSSLNDCYEGTFTWGGDGAELGIDLFSLGFARGLGKLVEEPFVSAVTKADDGVRGATAVAASADQALTEARAGREAAEQVLSDSESHLKDLRAGWRGGFNRVRAVLGTGPLPEAKAAAKEAEDDVGKAMAYEKVTESKVAEAQKELNMAESQLAKCESRDALIKSGVKVADSGGIDFAGVMHTALGEAHGPWDGGDNLVATGLMATPGVNVALGGVVLGTLMVRSTKVEISDIGAWSDDPAASQAESRGAAIKAVPVH